HDARIGLLAPLLRRNEEQLTRGGPRGDFIRDPERKVGSQVFDGLVAQLFEAAHVAFIVRSELVDAKKSVYFRRVDELEPVPIDHRAAAQQQAYGLCIAEGKLFEPALTWRGLGRTLDHQAGR